MKTMRYFLTLGAALVLAGCATAFRPWNLSEIKEGMTRDQVVHILGEPDKVFEKEGAEHLHYIYTEDFNPSMSGDVSYESSLNNNMRAMQLERSMKVYEYDVILVDGKVLNYKEIAN